MHIANREFSVVLNFEYLLSKWLMSVVSRILFSLSFAPAHSSLQTRSVSELVLKASLF